MKHYFLIPIFLFGCLSSAAATQTVEICGRDPAHTLIYRAKVPAAWSHIHPSPTESLTDTTKSICEFTLNEIRITVHNFPSDAIENRIPPSAQIARWKKQFTTIDTITSSTIPQSFSGFVGLLFEGNGVLNSAKTIMMGWSMQIAPEHYRSLTNPQLRADFTIKAVGPTELMAKERKTLIAFARSFELIEEIPANK